jgi:hypothetical protein
MKLKVLSETLAVTRLEPSSLISACIFAISTFDTDYLLVKSKALDHAVAVLTRAGFF